MKNIVNCYELDFVKDIPLEMNLLQSECEQLHTSNKKLKIALSVLILGIGAYFVYQTWFKKEEENKSKNSF